MPPMVASLRAQTSLSCFERGASVSSIFSAGSEFTKSVQQPRRHRDRALFLDLAADPAAQRDVEVRRGQLDAAVLGRDEDVRRDRQRAAQRDRPPDDAEAPRQVLLETRNFHCAHLCNHFASSIGGLLVKRQ